MEPVHKTLFGLLVVQLGLAAVTWSGRGAAEAPDARTRSFVGAAP